ncbi:MAG: glycosyltransferase family 2 protein [Myxococcota bacterium]
MSSLECDVCGTPAQAPGEPCALCAIEVPRFSVVVPVYQSARILPLLVARLQKIFETLAVSWELLLVDDASRDTSWDVVAGLASEDARIRGFRLMRNFGQHNALMCGFQHARGDFVVTLDDDLQNPPEELPKLIAEQERGGFDVVFGYFEDRRHSRFRNWTSRLSRQLIRVAIPGIHPRYSNYRLIARPVIDALARQQHDYLYTDGLISWITHHTSAVEVAHEERWSGDSNYTLGKLLRHFGVALLTFTALPLRAISLAGLAVAAGALAVGAGSVGASLAGHPVESGVAVLAVAVFFLGGVQLVCLGVVAEYVGKIFLKQSGKPAFLVRERRP